MPDFDAVSRDHVLQALAEYDERGADDFLAAYGFGRARDYVLWHDGRAYDSKAVLGVAQKYATGVAARSAEFSGGRSGAAKVLRALGFEVSEPGDDAPVVGGAWREASEVGAEVARDAWAAVARDVLLDAARRYHGVVTYKELAAEVQSGTGIRTRQLLQHWIGDVLGRVADECSHRDEPLLSSLCVNAQGSVGTGYATAVGRAYGLTPDDPDDHAARERLACHRRFGAPDLPADGGVPALTPRLAATRARTRRAEPVHREVATCPTCHMQLPVTGICDTCG
ncbi:hypothetical protein [Jiangella alba]|uniref:ScoMcrA-like N-terminal head domain-containing protein n=1 Tax=Jiangella alba TaxID=561176 RepID=A0A1H5K509_9ACTN|nr:hypothetical protein [Jiangella alba]SEE59128.1 hypothetical protein SAMN04488561_1868 [Jiangella alba]